MMINNKKKLAAGAAVMIGGASKALIGVTGLLYDESVFGTVADGGECYVHHYCAGNS